jgi:hypothetical protein
MSLGTKENININRGYPDLYGAVGGGFEANTEMEEGSTS